MTGHIIITAITLLAAVWLISRLPCCKGKRGTLDVSKLLDTGGIPVKRRKLRIGNTVFHVTSVFSGKAELDEALQNIAIKRQKDDKPPSVDS